MGARVGRHWLGLCPVVSPWVSRNQAQDCSRGCLRASGALPLPASAMCGPHAPPGVVVVVEVPQPEPLHLQPRLQDPGWRRVSGLGGWGW